MIQHRAESFVNYLSCIADEKSFKGMKSDCSLATPQDPLLTNEFADQILEGGVTRADGKKQGSIKRLINLVDDTDDSDVEITQPTEKTKSRRQASFGTATRKPMLQSTIDGGVGSSAHACSKGESGPMKSVIHGGRRKPPTKSKKKKVAPTQSQKKKEKVAEDIPELSDELDEEEVDEDQIGEEEREERQRSDVWWKDNVHRYGDLAAMACDLLNEEIDGDGDGEEEKLPTFELSMGKMKMMEQLAASRNVLLHSFHDQPAGRLVKDCALGRYGIGPTFWRPQSARDRPALTREIKSPLETGPP
ncbi:unnamed protein product [Brassica oleracea var. botrytis]|uniref:(rape) hypothetical protein n=1 Tax=Brassica napus TaxID=3708 RepID=A0A816KHB8_BRANA|nr:unnamed protein product [Brassica napus]